jgi:hypothetical protein
MCLQQGDQQQNDKTCGSFLCSRLKTIYNTTGVSIFVESCNGEPGLREIAGSQQARPSITPSSRGKSKTSFKFYVIWDQGSVYFASPVSDAVGGCLLIAMWYSSTSKSV